MIVIQMFPNRTCAGHKNTVTLCVLYNADLRRAQYAPIEREALLLRVEHGAVLLVRLRGVEDGLVLVGVEALAVDGRVEALEAVLLERAHEDVIRHLEAVMQRDEVLVVGRQLGGIDVQKRALEVVDRLDQVPCEALQGEVAS